MAKYQIRAIVKHENIVTFHVEADSLEAAKQVVKDDYENGTENAEFQCRSEIDDSCEFVQCDDPTCKLLDDEDDEDDFDDGDDLCDLCYSSGVNVERTTYCGKTIGIECGCDDDNDATCNDLDCEECAEGSAEDDAREARAPS